MDLVTNAVRIDHQAGILARDDAGDADVAGDFVDSDIGDPRRPRSAVARKLAVHIKRVSKTAAAHDIAFGFRLLPDRPGFPAGAFGHRIDEIDRTRVLQITQAIFDRIDAGLSGAFVDPGFMREVLGSAETPRSHEARTIGGMSCATTRKFS